MTDNAIIRIIRFIFAALTFLVSFLSICALISSNYGGTFDVFGFYGLFQPLLILLNLILLVYWIIRFKLLVIIPLVTILLNLGFIGSIYQIPIRPQKVPGTADNTIRLASYNAQGFYHGQRPLTVSLVSDFMKEKNVDILCMQEMDYDSTFTVDSIARSFSFLPYSTVALSSITGFNLMILSKFPIVRSIRIHFGDEGNQAMQTDLLINGDTVRVFTFHLQTTNFNQTKYKFVPQNWLWDLSGEAKKSQTVYDVILKNYRKRTLQATYIHNQIESSQYPTLVCGDMNSIPSSYTYHQIKGQLKDGFKTCGKGYEYTLLGLYRLYRIDYIFHSKDFQGYSYQSYKLDYSDHKPVIMELSLKGQVER